MTAIDNLTRLTHAYFDVNIDVVWDTVTKDLAPLIEVLEKAIEKES